MNGPDEFWTHVDRSAGADKCWPWTAGRFERRGGYGQVNYCGRVRGAHRVAYELAVGPIPEGLSIDHVRARGCVMTSCCNPAHLEAVTIRENIARTARPTCKRGHPKTSAHGRQRGTKWRCASCEVITQRVRRASRREAA